MPDLNLSSAQKVDHIPSLDMYSIALPLTSPSTTQFVSVTPSLLSLRNSNALPSSAGPGQIANEATPSGKSQLSSRVDPINVLLGGTVQLSDAAAAENASTSANGSLTRSSSIVVPTPVEHSTPRRRGVLSSTPASFYLYYILRYTQFVNSAISVRLDEEALRALSRLEALGLSRSEAIRRAIKESAAALIRRDNLIAEVKALEADETDRLEMIRVASLMEELRAQG